MNEKKVKSEKRNQSAVSENYELNYKEFFVKIGCFLIECL